eukprot:scaffold6781_cov107-Isochrysis_galbana.AAC.6
MQPSSGGRGCALIVVAGGGADALRGVRIGRAGRTDDVVDRVPYALVARIPAAVAETAAGLLWGREAAAAEATGLAAGTRGRSAAVAPRHLRLLLLRLCEYVEDRRWSNHEGRAPARLEVEGPSGNSRCERGGLATQHATPPRGPRPIRGLAGGLRQGEPLNAAAVVQQSRVHGGTGLGGVRPRVDAEPKAADGAQRKPVSLPVAQIAVLRLRRWERRGS